MEKMVRWLTIGLAVVFTLLWLAIGAGLRYNGTASLPMGFYRVTRKRPEKGDLVFISLPQAALFEMAKARGYLDVAFEPVQHLLKRLAAVAGDHVTIDAAGVEVNETRLANSTPLTKDEAARPLRCYPLQNYILGRDEILVMSESPASFDSRYFGPLKTTMLESVVKPLLTW
jgi:conjugative transfer signal peptidase TraF